MVSVGQFLRYHYCLAQRKVGIAGNKIAPELIDRSQFIDGNEAAEMEEEHNLQSPAIVRKRSIDEVTATPEGVVSGSSEAMELKLKALKEYAKQLEDEIDKPYDALRGGLLVPEKVAPPERRTTKSRLSDMSGSVTMRDILGERSGARPRSTLQSKQLQLVVKISQRRGLRSWPINKLC